MARQGPGPRKQLNERHPFWGIYCTYVGKFSGLGRLEDRAEAARWRTRGESSLFLKIVFDKGGPPAY